MAHGSLCFQRVTETGVNDATRRLSCSSAHAARNGTRERTDDGGDLLIRDQDAIGPDADAVFEQNVSLDCREPLGLL